MNCGMECIKYLLFVFNCIFAISGLGILIIGILVHLHVSVLTEVLEANVTFPAIACIIIGSIIFIIAFFGCCGAIRESHCMTVTFAVLMLTILIIQIAIAAYAFVYMKSTNLSYKEIFDRYNTNKNDQAIIDTIQTTFHCCGIQSPEDFHGKIPESCCKGVKNCSQNNNNVYEEGCESVVKDYLKQRGTTLGGVAIGVGVIEVAGIIFSLCLANSIRNAERRGYRV